MHSLNTRRGLGLAAAMTLAAGALVAPTGAAAPADPNGSTIDPDAATTLTVHKCEQTDTNGVKEGTGNEEPQAECKPVSGVEFTITKLNVDLTTYKGWKQLADAKGDVLKAGALKTGTVQKITTGGDGLAAFTDAQTDVGAYLVSETRTPDKVIPAEDFVVTLPMTNPQDTAKWNYNVHVYPKNSLASLTKTVDDSVQQAGYLGKNVKWTITTDIPHSGQGTSIDSYVITDTLPAGMTVTNISAEINNNGGWLSVPYDLNCVGSVTCTFTSDGLAKLRNLGGRKVLLHLTVDVTDVTASDQGVFTNKAQVTINGTASVEVSAQTTWGQLRVYKYDRENLGTLQDAKFSLCLEPSCDTIVQQDVATNDQGILNFPALRPGTYYLVETTPPAGYVLDATPQQVTVLPGNTEPPADATARVKNYHTMSNVKQNVPQLPLTGGIGQVALAAGGIGLLLIGAMVMITSRMGTRRNRI